MNKKINFHIAEPCHENWDAMTKVEQGRFCNSCAKQVVDFSLMNDRQILDYFAKAKGGTCGRFTSDQLDRPLDNKPGVKKVSIWKWVLTVWMSVWLSNRAHAQTSQKGQTKIEQDDKKGEFEVITVGKVLPKPMPAPVEKTHTIAGIVYDEHNNVLENATISMQGKAYGISDSEGKFSFEKKIKHPKDSMKIQVSYLGYETKKIKVMPANGKALEIHMEVLPALLQEVVITAYPEIERKRTHLSGAVIMVKGDTIGEGLTKWNRFIDTVQKVTGNGMFKAYPNPAVRGRYINIVVKEEGNYFIQLISNASQIITYQKLNAAKEQTVQFNINANLAAGIYFIRMINEKTKKQYTDKLLLMPE